jgi:copper chaperone CopZ
VHDALVRVAGVKKVEVDFEGKQATVEGAACNADEMIAALSKAGYKARLK